MSVLRNTIAALRDLNHRRLRRRSGHADRDNAAYARWVRENDTLDDAARADIRKRIGALPHRPLISVVMPVHRPEPAWLADAIDSVRAQLYTDWELCIVDDHSDDPRITALLQHYAASDARIRVAFRATNGHICAASNDALALARGEFIALLDHDDLLAEHALALVAETLARFPHASVLYSDEDKFDAHIGRHDAYFKCDWNLELFRGQNLISHLGVYRTSLVRALGGFRAGFEGSQDYDLALRCVETLAPAQIVHIPHVLYHWRVHAGSTAHGADAKPYAREAARRALAEHFARCGIACDLDADTADWHRPHYRLPQPPPTVLLVVADAAGPRRLKQCLTALRWTDYAHREVVVASATKDTTLPEACNRAIAEGHADIIAIVDSRCRFHGDDWLDRLVAQACLPNAGAVGAKLLCKRGRIIGNARLLGGSDGHATLALGTRANRAGYFGRACLAQHVAVLGEGCIVMRSAHMRTIGALDATYRDLGAAFVDFTWRLHAQGLRNHWTPIVEATLAPHDRQRRRIAASDAQRVARRWSFHGRRDTHANANLDWSDGPFRLAWPPRVSLARPWFAAP